MPVKVRVNWTWECLLSHQKLGDKNRVINNSNLKPAWAWDLAFKIKWITDKIKKLFRARLLPQTIWVSEIGPPYKQLYNTFSIPPTLASPTGGSWQRQSSRHLQLQVREWHCKDSDQMFYWFLGLHTVGFFSTFDRSFKKRVNNSHGFWYILAGKMKDFNKKIIT